MKDYQEDPFHNRNPLDTQWTILIIKTIRQTI